ncbi:MAG: Uma2 family endonuclease [Pseudomonadota bacterium]|nr:Uma2 family endonuclease [Pseudomonadota bacterium]
MHDTTLRRHKLTVDDFHRLGQAGILAETDRVELIDGELIDMAPIGSRHAECVSRLTRLLVRQTGAVVRVQDPIRLPRHSQPQPDIAVVRPGDYGRAHPGPADVLLLIEMAVELAGVLS